MRPVASGRLVIVQRGPGSGRYAVAIVGMGPKGLHCLERLVHRLVSASAPAGDVRIDIYEPHPHPGAGPVYDPHQPHWLRLNFANRFITAWCDDSGLVFDDTPTFVEFLGRVRPGLDDPDGYAPRALVGEYLHACFRSICGVATTISDVSVRVERVGRVERCDVGTFLVDGDGPYDEVLVATGHDSRASTDWAMAAPIVAPAFPVDRRGGVVDVEPDSTVALRGLGLTAIDVALTLSEGRGGRFDRSSDPGDLRYRASGREPVIVGWSRTGRLMRPKDDPAVGRARGEATGDDGCARAALTALTTCPPEEPIVPRIRAILERRAAEILHGLGVGSAPNSGRPRVSALFEARDPADDPASELRTAVRIADGRSQPDPVWALASAWRGVYPALVVLVASRRIDAEWPSFASLAAAFERISFGPTAENAARFLALIDAGIVDLSVAGGPVHEVRDGRHHLRLGTTQRSADVLIDAVLGAPGISSRSSPVLGPLLEEGVIGTLPHGVAMAVLSDGSAVGADGTRVHGLAVIGRATEGCVLGNDTLSRTLHPTAQNWADAVYGRITSAAACAIAPGRERSCSP